MHGQKKTEFQKQEKHKENWKTLAISLQQKFAQNLYNQTMSWKPLHWWIEFIIWVLSAQILRF